MCPVVRLEQLFPQLLQKRKRLRLGCSCLNFWIEGGPLQEGINQPLFQGWRQWASRGFHNFLDPGYNIPLYLSEKWGGTKIHEWNRYPREHPIHFLGGDNINKSQVREQDSNPTRTCLSRIKTTTNLSDIYKQNIKKINHSNPIVIQPGGSYSKGHWSCRKELLASTLPMQ